ncbi:TetR/AcrR family transcriptional regulator [uncultured Gordonia sp.]|uniref:TetR/AcrR family transcriptional regulator n=1 Tax=Gordonia sp. (in: high G+C Gram-positive bacteria) TaxID=84139 RepID=UPI002616845B|nr:TetR/AcrR family transcriptional regulator [uncultured Gordonia sp.]
MTQATRTYGGVSADERRALRRRQLIDAFFRCLAAGPTEGVSLRAVTAQAGLNPRYVYEQFTNLEGLFIAAYDLALSEIAQSIGTALNVEAVEAADDVAAIVAAICTFVEEAPHKARLVVVDSLKIPALAARRRVAIEASADQFARRLGSQPAYRHLDRDRIALTARFLVGATGEVIVGTVDHTIPGAPTDHVAALTALFTGALTAQ